MIQILGKHESAAPGLGLMNNGTTALAPDGQPYSKILLTADRGYCLQADANGVTVVPVADNPAQLFEIVEDAGSLSLALNSVNYAVVTLEAGAMGGAETFEFKYFGVTVDNRHGNSSITQTLALAYSMTDSVKFETSHSDETSKTLTTEFSVGGTIGKILKLDSKLSAGYTDSETDTTLKGQEQTKTQGYTIEVEVTVPARKSTFYFVSVTTGKLPAPFDTSVTFNSSLPGVAPFDIPVSGNYTGWNTTNVEVIGLDMMEAPHRNEEPVVFRRPVLMAA